MANRPCLPAVFACLLVATAFEFGQRARAQTVWSGFSKSFTKASFTDPTLPQHQDALTSNVVLTRGSAGGLINIVAESSYDQAVSPARTLWATDRNNPGETIAAANWPNLVFTNWINAYGGSHTAGAFIEGRNAVVKLTSDIASEVVYLDLRFTSWAAGSGLGYSYVRGEPTGDYNGNEIVDAADYVVWRATVGQTGIPFGSGADGNANGEIDFGDYAYWRERFGNAVGGSGFGTIATAPEPSAVIFAILGVGLMCVARCGAQRRLLPAGSRS